MLTLFAILTSIVAAEAEPAEVFMLSYFRTPAEALHLAYSKDGLEWTALNDNKPVLHASVGNKSVRDPFIRKGADGLFHMICTDSWGSKSIIHTKSKDLVNWESQHLLPVMASIPNTKNAWAPEFVYDEEKGEYVIFWASVTEPDGYQRIWSCRTRDFESFSEPVIMFDPGYTVIDSTIVRGPDSWIMLFKDERGENKAGTDNKAMRVASAERIDGPYGDVSDLVTPHLTEGPAVFEAGGRWLMLYDHFMEHKWGASESRNLRDWVSVSDRLVVPEECRHGSVFSVTQNELARIRELLKQ